MPKTILTEVFEAVREMGLTRTESEFSVDWLGRSECYMRTLRFENQSPSIATIAICEANCSTTASVWQEHSSTKRLADSFCS